MSTLKTTVSALALLVLSATSGFASEISLIPTSGNHKSVIATVTNGAPVEFMLDTGAYMTVISAADAGRIGLSTASQYVVKYEAVQGVTGNDTFPVIKIAKLMVGSETLANFLVAVGGSMTLLGQDFLQKFPSYSIDNVHNVLTLNPVKITPVDYDPFAKTRTVPPPAGLVPDPTPAAPPAVVDCRTPPTPRPAVCGPPPASPPPAPATTVAYENGRRDRQWWENWYNTLGELHNPDYTAGATWWSSVRSTKEAAKGCSSDEPDFTTGCLDAKARLDPTDRRRNSEPDYKAGWNSIPEPPRPSVQSQWCAGSDMTCSVEDRRVATPKSAAPRQNPDMSYAEWRRQNHLPPAGTEPQAPRVQPREVCVTNTCAN